MGARAASIFPIRSASPSTNPLSSLFRSSTLKYLLQGRLRFRWTPRPKLPRKESLGQADSAGIALRPRQVHPVSPAWQGSRRTRFETLLAVSRHGMAVRAMSARRNRVAEIPSRFITVRSGIWQSIRTRSYGLPPSWAAMALWNASRPSVAVSTPTPICLSMAVIRSCTSSESSAKRTFPEVR